MIATRDFDLHKLQPIVKWTVYGLAARRATLSHWLYTWDTFLWIAGFAAIEVNINEWREEFLEEVIT